MSYDPEIQARQLFQCLSQDKNPIGFLLGAGCPCSIKDSKGKPLIPNLENLTQIVGSAVNKGEPSKAWEKIYSLLTKDGRVPNIEDILSRVRGLREYTEEGIESSVSIDHLAALEKEICDVITATMNRELPDKSTAYHQLANWVGSIDRPEPVELFTLNYDLLLEQALEDFRVPFFDGFIGSNKPFFDPYSIEYDALPPRWTRVWKMHGSINWRKKTENDRLRVWRSIGEAGGEVVIHPSYLKYEQSRKMPYLAMMDRLRRFLSRPRSALITIGYSFKDQHVNDAIIQSLQGTPTSTTFALLHGPISKYQEALTIARERGNLILLAKDGAVIGTKKDKWIESDEEKISEVVKGTIDWHKEPNENEPWIPNLKLGNFNILGTFLQDISGVRDRGGTIFEQ